ncbi:Hypothetical predicted protein, partial [Paramuricea clavata]
MTVQGRTIQNEFNSAISLKHIRVSLCNRTVSETHAFLNEKILSTTSESSRVRLGSISCLLDELLVFGCMEFHVAFDHYSSKNTTLNCANERNCKKQFKVLVLSKSGLPVAFLDCGEKQYLLLLERPLDNILLLQCLDDIIYDSTGKAHETLFPNHTLCSSVPHLMKLLSSSRDRAIVMFILSSIFSARALRIAFGFREHIVNKAVEDIQSFVEELENQHFISNQAENLLSQTVSRLEEEINSSDRRPNKRVLEDSEDDMEFEINNKRARLQHLKTNKVAVKERMARRLFHKWKRSLRSQRGKGQGRYRIDRGAESAINDILYEQSKAHNR